MVFGYAIWASVCLIAALFYLRVKARYKSLGKIPGNPPKFLIGNIPVMDLYRKPEVVKRLFTDEAISEQLRYRDAGMNVIWYGLKPVVSVFQAEIVQLVIGGSLHNEKSFLYSLLHKWIGTGLATSSGEKWRYRRRILTPCFHLGVMEDFFPVINQQSLDLVRKLKSLSHGDFVDITPLIVPCALDIICETMMGVSIGAQKGHYSEYVEAVHSLSVIYNQRAIRPWLWFNFLFDRTDAGKKFNGTIDTLHNFTDKVIKEKKDMLLSGNTERETEKDYDSLYGAKKRKAFMDLLLDMHLNEQKLSEADIREEVDTFMAAGYETTSMATVYSLYCIGLYPEVQERISEELKVIFNGDTEKFVTYDDTKRMKYLECVLKESLRLYPPLPVIGRKLAEDVNYGDFRIPKNTTIRINILGLHRNPKEFPNPEVFDPERFLPENSAKRHPYAYIPFSAGPRNCIGQKFAMQDVKIILCNVLRHFTVVSLDQRDKLKLDIDFNLKPAQEVRMKFLPKT